MIENSIINRSNAKIREKPKKENTIVRILLNVFHRCKSWYMSFQVPRTANSRSNTRHTTLLGLYQKSLVARSCDWRLQESRELTSYIISRLVTDWLSSLAVRDTNETISVSSLSPHSTHCSLFISIESKEQNNILETDAGSF